ncbi:hypothetical protein LJG62_10385 [Pseudomonas aeruginosa]|uniref:LysM peptidoglycan-binding domain-containing protein n=1 Tax=Pseudomonas aeruginosa TaxID=287 RepID=UPI0018C4D169|nr:hypothetical protein [Pseudomonas aeruginosa]MBG4007879.1 hypothetical protein [Pseudomonas aeruginosa]MCC0463796.1 hypothetical protein [Pseudomonas aeruginosa]UNK98157.1 hypothetical protein MN178_06950 [Pseudomonas aeruginosa]HEJ1368114.1 hypothetical protein [Pseudomonas aeruginosa]HEJ4193334.1 hypothetical protein [Pseudomonas aeruginosa]
MTESKICTCPSGDGSLRWPCPKHPAVEQADVAAKLTFINGRPAMCGCQVEYSDGGGEYSDVIYVTLCAKHSGSAILDLVATNRIALTPEYEGQWHADLYLDREIPLAKVEGATPAEAVLALMSAERIDPEQESVEQAGGDERAEFERAFTVQEGVCFDDKRGEYRSMNLREIEVTDAQDLNLRLQGWQARAALAQPSPAPELERPEVAEVAFVLRNIGAMDAEDIDGDNVDLRFEDAEGRDTGCDVSIVEYAEKAADLFEQHDRIVGALRAENAKLSEALDRWPLIRDSLKLRLADALARVAELERQEPVAWMHDQPNRVDVIHRDVKDLLQRVPGSSRGIHRPLDVSEHYTIPLYAAPVAQAQHSVPAYVSYTTQPAESLAGIALRQLKDESRWVEIRDINAHAFPDMRSHSYYPAGTVIKLPTAAPGNSAQHSVPEGWMLVECGIWTQEQVDEMQKTVTRFRNSEFVDDRALAMAVADAGQCKAPEISLAELLAAAPGKEVGHE